MSDIQQIIIERSIDFAKQKMKSIHSSHGFDHVKRVIAIAEKIGQSEPNSDSFIIQIAAILHDIERAEQDRQKGKVCHAELGSKSAYTFLRESGLDENRAIHISQCILTHRYRNEHTPESIEAKVLYDADKLGSIGAIGIGRAFLFAGEVGARLHDPDVDINKTHAYSEDDTAYREFLAKLQYIKDKMLTQEGTRIAQLRHTFMTDFFARLNSEVLAKC